MEQVPGVGKTQMEDSILVTDVDFDEKVSVVGGRPTT